ncbi:hypothetical protein Moror_8237 [Moniliophthora roreri MCA 2997]|uniref:C2H2-type domain-containing protein n=1 Tax=Moniliophthora roreri (strain MCA 2997) TaxID=1381753 RepID=V2XKK1_MONRO|nr:hypothetical protein Moror_8237 [Moniliophthora roreri MCA 2997]
MQHQSYFILPSSSPVSPSSPTHFEDLQTEASAARRMDNDLRNHHTRASSTYSSQYFTSIPEAQIRLSPAHRAYPSGQPTTNHFNYQNGLQTNLLIGTAGKLFYPLGNVGYDSLHNSDISSATLPPYGIVGVSRDTPMRMPSDPRGLLAQGAGYRPFSVSPGSLVTRGPGLEYTVGQIGSSASKESSLPAPSDANYNSDPSTSQHMPPNLQVVCVHAEVETRCSSLPINSIPIPSHVPSDTSSRPHSLQFSGSSRESTQKSITREGMGYPSPISDTKPSPAATAPPPLGCIRPLAKDGVIRASKGRRKHEAKYKCPCGQSFTTKNGLRNHDKARRGIREFKCQRCPKDFVTKHDCKRHERSCKSPRVLTTQA